mgnify:CR=1 FL=1
MKKRILKKLLVKPTPLRYSLSAPYEVQKSYDFFSVTGSVRDHEDALLTSCREDGTFDYIYWAGEDRDPTNDNCSFEDIIYETLSVRHRFRTWDIRYDSLREAYIHDLARLPLLKWHYQKLRNLFIKPILPSYRIKILKLILHNHQNGKSNSLHSILEALHGPAIRLSSDRQQHEQDLRFQLESLALTEDVVTRNRDNDLEFIGRRNDFVRPRPGAITTIAEYDMNMMNHHDTKKLASMQLVLGFGMFILAAVTFLVELLKTAQ